MDTAVKIKFPDGSERDFPKGSTGLDIAKAISPRLAKEAIAVKINGEIHDLNEVVNSGSPVQILSFKDPEGRAVFWHSSSHIMAQAVVDLFPKAKLAIGPPIDEGFYYDFEVEKPFAPEDLESIEKRMHEIIKEKAVFEPARKCLINTRKMALSIRLNCSRKIFLMMKYHIISIRPLPISAGGRIFRTPGLLKPLS